MSRKALDFPQVDKVALRDQSRTKQTYKMNEVYYNKGYFLMLSTIRQE